MAGVPFGYMIVPDPREQAAIKKMVELRKARQSYRRIAAELAADGMPLGAASVMRILERVRTDERPVRSRGRRKG